MPHLGRLLFGIILGLAALGAVGAAPAAELAAVNHFDCYKVDPGSTWKPVGLVLSTQFGRAKASVNQLASLCAPASKNGSPIFNKRAHLACYPIKASAFSPRTVLITNQFEKSAPMTVVSPATLCVPTGKSLVAGVTPPLVKGLDNYECFLVKPQSQIGAHSITVIDQFGQAGGSALQPLTLCAPAGINGSPLLNAATHLVCYGIKLGPAVKAKHVWLNNRFGLSQGTAFLRQSLCVPSIKKLG